MKTKIWYVLQASDLVGSTSVQLYPDEAQARKVFNLHVEQAKKDVIQAGHEKELTNDEYCTIEQDYAFFSYEINGCNGCDYAITLSSQEVET